MSQENLLLEIKNELVNDDPMKKIIESLDDLSSSSSELEERLKQSGLISFVKKHD